MYGYHFINVGGMIYDWKRGKGDGKGKVVPSPKKVEHPLNSTIQLHGRNESSIEVPVLNCSKEIAVDDDEWAIEAFYQANNYKSS